jgi:hypothetical protein
MNKRIIALLIVGAFLISGCALAERFQEAKDAYLQERVGELLAEDQVEEPVVEELPAEVTEEPKVVETEEPEVEETLDPDEELEAEETPEVEEETEADETPEADDAMEADETPVVESDDPGVFLGDPDWQDDMEPGEYYWNLETDDYMAVAYDDGTLQLRALSEVMGWRIASTPVLGDAYIEADVQMGACSTSDGYGLVFRVPEQVAYNQGYFFGVTCDGKYSLRVWDGLSGQNGKTTWLRYPKGSEFVLKGKDAVNTLGVMLVDDSITLYINGELVEQFNDDTYMEGFFGLFINRDHTENLTINVDQVSYWTDPLE